MNGKIYNILDIMSRMLWMNCVRCRKRISGFKQLKDNGYFDTDDMICNRCRKKLERKDYKGE